MMGTVLSAWLLTGLFGLAAVAYLGVAVATAPTDPAPLADRVSTGWHVVMCVAMIAMLWEWGMAVPPLLFILVFIGAALWFAGRGMYRRRAGPDVWSESSTHRGPSASGGHAGHGGGYAFHALMMGAMAVMAGVMAARQTPAGGASSAAGSAPAMAGMAMDTGGRSGSAMSGMTGTTGLTGMAGMTGTAPATGWLSLVCLVFGAVFAVAAAWILLGLRSRTATPGAAVTATAIVNLVMSAGMAVVFLQMS